MITVSQMALRHALSPSPATATSTTTHPRNTILGREPQGQSSKDPATKNEKGIARRRGFRVRFRVISQSLFVVQCECGFHVLALQMVFPV